MGIKGLGKFLLENAPRSVRQLDMKALQGRILAIDASMSLYQFMIAIRDQEHFGNLVNDAGEVTSHIMGILSRVVKLLENGVKPVYVFDGKPTDLKSAELARRSALKKEAAENLAQAEEAGDKEAVKKYTARTVKVTESQNDDVKKLLKLIGVPVIEAPDEAEAQCARLTADGLVYATATEDADALTFGSPVLIRHLNVSDAKSKTKPILSFTLATILEDLRLSMDEFIDFCILCGCDYVERAKGVGPATAYKLLQQFKSIDAIKEANKIAFPEVYPYVEVLTKEEIGALTWRDPDESGLRAFLIDQHSFNATRVEGYLTRLRSARKNSTQTRLSNFFGPVKVVPAKPPPKIVTKRKSISNGTSTDVKKKKQKV